MDINALNSFFQYINDKNENIGLRTSACVFLKNYIIDYFYDNSDNAIINKDKIMDDECKNHFKNNILNLMLNVESNLLPNIIEMIKFIVENANGYLVIWPKLMNFIGEVLNKHDFAKSRYIYQLISKIIRRYHIESKSAPLFKEIIHTMKFICQPMTDDSLKIIQLFNNWNTNGQVMYQCLEMMNKIMSIFFSLNYQDFPEFFEDHLEEWVNILNDTLILPNKTAVLDHIDDNLQHLAIKVKAKALKNINLYYSNYFDDIEKYATHFSSSVWTLMCQNKIRDNYSKLTKELLDFFKTAFQMERIKSINLEQIKQIFEFIIFPNLTLTNKECEDYKDNPIEFLKIEFEEYDMSSNKYFSINLLQIIISHYEEVNNQIIIPKIKEYLSEYNNDKFKNWNKKIVAINLLFASCIKTFAQRYGVTELNPNSVFNDINSLINEIFIKEFQTYDSHELAQIFTLKFLSTFRLQITDLNTLGKIIIMLIKILQNSKEPTQNACLLCLDQIINMKDLQTMKSRTYDIVNNDDIFNTLISSLMKFITTNTNIFAMRCFFRVLKLTKDQKLQVLSDSIGTSMDAILKLIIEKPQTDEFNYYFFETCSLIMKKFDGPDKTLINKFENKIRADLNLILQNNVTDLLGYVFQLFAFYVFLTNDNNEFYQNILRNILTNEKMWDINMKYLYPPSIEFIKVILMTNQQFSQNKEVIDLLFKICQTLLTNKSFIYVFQLIEYMINYTDTNLYGESLTKFLKMTNQVAIENMNTNPKVFHDINQEMILLLSKLSLKININLSMEIIKILSDNPIQYLIDMIEEIFNLKKTKDKKLVVFWYMQILYSFHNNIDDKSIVIITSKLLDVIKNFYGINIKRYYNLGKNEDLSYAANNYNKLTFAVIEHQINAYKSGEECDENKIFFQTQKYLKQNKNVDYINEALKLLKGKELDRMKSFINQNENNFQ